MLKRKRLVDINSLSRSILGATIVLTLLSIFSKGFGFFREVIFASYFGLSKGYEIYLVSVVLPITINTIIIYITQNFYIPLYTKKNIINSDSTRKFFAHSVVLVVVSSSILALLLYLLAEQVLGLYLLVSHGAERSTILSIFKLFLITIPIGAFTSILSAHLLAEKKFYTPSLVQFVLNIAIIFSIMTFSHGLGIYAILYGYIFGGLLQLGILIIILRKMFVRKYFSVITKSDFSLVGGSFFFTILIESMSQIHAISDRQFINQTDPGGIAAISYATTIFILPISIISISLSTVLFPAFSESLARNDNIALLLKIKKSLMFNFSIFMPVTIIFLLYPDTIVRLIFERGDFNVGDTVITSQVLMIYSISLMFYGAYSIMYKVFYSASMLKALAILILVSAGIKFLLNFLLIHNFKQNGLAFSSSIVFIFLCLFSILMIQQKIKINIMLTFINYFLVFIIVAVIALAVSTITAHIFILGGLTTIFKISIFLLIYSITLTWIIDFQTLIPKKV